MGLENCKKQSTRRPQLNLYTYTCLSAVFMCISGAVGSETENRASFIRPEIAIREPEPEITCSDILFNIQKTLQKNHLELIKLEHDLEGLVSQETRNVNKRGKQDDVFIPSGLDNLDRMTSILDKFHRMSVKSMTMKTLQDKMRQMGKRK